MAKFTICAEKTISYEMEIEATTANEAEEMYWDMDGMGKEVGEASIVVYEVHDANGDLVTDFEKNYDMEVQNA